MISEDLQKDFEDYKSQLLSLIGLSDCKISEIKPSDWIELHRLMTSDLTAVKGMFKYYNSPYSLEIVDTLHPSHPARIVAIMKGAQIGFSTGVIEAGIAWIIANAPGNILFLVGHADLVKDSAKKLDTLIDNTGIRKLIKSSSKKARNTKTGDTDTMKEYAGGYLKLGITNHKMLRNISMQYGFIDDFDGMKSDSDSDGDTMALIEQRFAAFYKKMKLYYISTPTTKNHSNIEKAYLNGDQRKYNVPCECCNELIVIEWECDSEVNEGEKAGITWELDENNELKPESVGYTCQKCGGFFDDRNKMELINKGVWIPTATPIAPDYYSYHLSALTAPIFMYGWEHYVRQYMECNPIGEKRDEKKYQTFANLVLGETYEQRIDTVSATELQDKIRPYEIGEIPESLSIRDGNGKIVMLTLGSDLNGKEDDARLDYEIVAHSESGATYSIDHGSIGTFIPKDSNPLEREHWTYRHGSERSVWVEFEKILNKIYLRDNGEGGMRLFLSGVDSGYMNDYAFQFINNQPENVVGLKGDGKNEMSFKKGADFKSYRKSKRGGRLYLVESNLTKDVLAGQMALKWNPQFNSVQPYGYMNFPTPSQGKYLLSNFFSHFEAEQRVYEPKKKSYVWKKKHGRQNHLYDCRLYAMVCRDIFLDAYFKDLGIRNGVWKDYVNSVV